jgi:hypothetical protein
MNTLSLFGHHIAWRIGMNKKDFGDMPFVDLVLIPELGQPQSLPYPTVQEARFNARGFSRKGLQKLVAWYVLDENGLILDHHGYAIETLRWLRPDAHTERDLQRIEQIGLSRNERAQLLIDQLANERRAAAWN